jgi:hypothetical protein
MLRMSGINVRVRGISITRMMIMKNKMKIILRLILWALIISMDRRGRRSIESLRME